MPKCQTRLDSSHLVRGQQRTPSMYSYLQSTLDLPFVPLKGLKALCHWEKNISELGKGNCCVNTCAADGYIPSTVILYPGSIAVEERLTIGYSLKLLALAFWIVGRGAADFACLMSAEGAI